MTRLLQNITALFACLSTLFASAAFAVTVEHAVGQTQLDKTPERIVVIGHASLDVLDNLGVPPVGVVHHLLPSYLQQYNDKSIASVGTLHEPDFEAIFMARPDLIIAEGRALPHVEELQKIAPTYVVMMENGHYWRDMTQHWRNIALMVDKQGEVESLISELEGEIAALSAKAKAAELDTMVVMNAGGNVTMFGRDSRFSQIFNEFGFTPASSRNVEATAGPHGHLISFEYIVDAAPQSLMIMDREQAIGRGAGKAQAFFDNALVNGTEAAQNGKLIYLNPEAWYITAGGIQATRVMLQDIQQALN
ncbi:siderophore ABC transporter substrate-binding protein [Aliagarivorans marinus]|uniref:siderophore ABC transporter substrate-binding protein n=1 Tax=Aliagarivorans marinus TaxID=561965 RepID=UPI0004127754|nr:ABC transporter substrate-binding protein [Aliagarivorans marinus]